MQTLRSNAPIRLGVVGIFTLLIALAFWTHPQTPSPAFDLPPTSKLSSPTKQTEKPWLRRESLPVAAPSVHAPTLTELPNGRLAAAWFAGSREGASDVRIVFSERKLPHASDSPDPSGTQGHWERPRTIASREQTERDTRRNVRKLGNPVLFTDGNTVHLFYVSAGMGGWAGSSINHRRSNDGGENWGSAKKIISSPFMNVSTLVRTPPVRLADGSLGLPVYHELITKHGEWLRLSPHGEVLSKTRMPHPRATLQPSVIALDTQHAIAFLRDAGPGEGHIQISQTRDAGQTWQAQNSLPLTNPNASIAAIKLHDGRILLAANPSRGRHILELWLSDTTGQNWTHRAIVDSPDTVAPSNERNTSIGANNAEAPAKSSGPAVTDESSYPALLQTRDGNIHLAYTWHRQRIRLVSFNVAWLNSQASAKDTAIAKGRP